MSDIVAWEMQKYSLSSAQLRTTSSNRYREFDALDMDLRDAYPDRRESLPRLPPKVFCLPYMTTNNPINTCRNEVASISCARAPHFSVHSQIFWGQYFFLLAAWPRTSCSEKHTYGKFVFILPCMACYDPDPVHSCFRSCVSGCPMVPSERNTATTPSQEFFKLAPDVVERRTKGLEMYMSTLIRRFPDMLESSHLDRCGTGRQAIA